ncbi:Glucose/sorbosone dehydrogenase-like protein [Fibrella aestuarina BUZ 2]|uniref:Glucose/sorbosone dehydrogenase-like protein n=1 Tax=Fibrella aestuarina BUZ 2 TaxID=1166018 RepID=I0KGQ3_9BACT|nr:glucose sorbosone dehydrogenase [Fibrella aestuarina]CCH03306.1 Glucose/sorbosone dehydrogenase-like protein [Fibrella aestuarina BUZ 2]
MLNTLLLLGTLLTAPADTITDYYEVETIPTPVGLSAETGGLAFLPDGRLAACFHRGEVMLYSPKTKQWRVFAEGLHDPLGVMAISNRELLVMQRPELTRLIDTNGDGVADRYETVSDQFGMSGNYHEFAFGPIRDAKGNLYIGLNTASNGAGIRQQLRGAFNPLGRPGRMYACVPYRGWVMQITPTGQTIPYALGFRSPDGLGFDAQGRFLVTDNQGDWLGTSKLHVVKPGAFHGHVTSLVWKGDFPKIDPLTLPVSTLDSLRTHEAVAFPHSLMAHSPTQPVVDNTGGKFGPFAGQTFVGEMDYPHLLRVLLEEIGGQTQGACIPFLAKGGQRIGNHRLAFGPDGSLYLGQTDHGWTGAQGIQRVRFKGGQFLDIAAMHLTATGFELNFTLPVREAEARELANYTFQRYQYKYHRDYGSPQINKATVPVQAVRLSPDRRTVSIDITDLQEGFIYELSMGRLQTETGKKLLNTTICYTLNKLNK